MKKILFAAMALAAFAACSKETTVEVNREAIAFGQVFVDNSTKAAIDPSYGNAASDNPLTSFNVYGAVQGVNIFNGNTVSKGENDYGTEAWNFAEGTPTQYWVAGASYIFDAVVDATTVNTDANTGLPVSLTYDVTTQKDMLHDRVETTGAANHGLVAFTFPHLLSKVKLTVKNSSAADATNYRITITDIVLSDIYSKGDYLVSGSWDNLTEGGPYTIADMKIASATEEECAAEVLLIPDADYGISFKVNVQIQKGENWETLTSTEFKKENVGQLVANHAYNLKAEYTIGGEIKFTATEMAEWANGNTHDTNEDNVKDSVVL